LHRTAAFQGCSFVRGVMQKILNRFEEKRAKATAATIGLAQPVGLQNHEEEILGQILGIRSGVSLPANVGKNRMPVGAT
jgi:hypothetical protein